MNDIEPAVVPTVSVEDLMTQIQALQKRMDAQNAQFGVSNDPLADALRNLKAHVKARGDASPLTDFTPLHTRLGQYEEDKSTKNAELLRMEIVKFVQRNPHLELDYLPELAVDLHMATVEAA